MSPDRCRRDRLEGTWGATGALIAFLATAAGSIIAVVAKTVYRVSIMTRELCNAHEVLI